MKAQKFMRLYFSIVLLIPYVTLPMELTEDEQIKLAELESLQEAQDRAKKELLEQQEQDFALALSLQEVEKAKPDNVDEELQLALAISESEQNAKESEEKAKSEKEALEDIKKIKKAGSLVSLKGMLLEPVTLKFQAAWCAVANNQDLEVTGADEIVVLGNKIKNIQKYLDCPEQERKLFINLANSDLSDEKIQEFFPELIKKYLKETDFKSKIQLLNAMLLASYNNPALTQLSIDAGAEINAEGESQNTPFINAIRYGPYYDFVNSFVNKVVVKKLIKAGANINAKNVYGDTALIIASGHTCNLNNIEVVKMLIQAGADVNVENEHGATPLIHAVTSNRKEIVEVLLTGNANVNYYSKQNKTALMEAIEKGYEDIVQILLNAGADFNFQNKDCDTALIYAVRFGKQYDERKAYKIKLNKSIVQMLLRAGIDVNAKNNNGDTALIIAAGKHDNENNKEVVKILIEAGADVHAKNNNGWTALKKAKNNKWYSTIASVLHNAGARYSDCY